MPKIKTKKSAAKRFRISGKGKVIRYIAFRRHLLTKKTSKRKRGLRGSVVVHKSNQQDIKRLIPYK